MTRSGSLAGNETSFLAATIVDIPEEVEKPGREFDAGAFHLSE
jgi:hypothetical protein